MIFHCHSQLPVYINFSSEFENRCNPEKYTFPPKLHGMPLFQLYFIIITLYRLYLYSMNSCIPHHALAVCLDNWKKSYGSVGITGGGYWWVWVLECLVNNY